MKKNQKNQTIISIIALAFSVIAIILVLTSQPKQPDYEWGCSLLDCVEFKDITGEEWARENCQITAQGTICLVVFEDGRTLEVPLEELNLTEISATKCTEYICVEETMFRRVNYTINIDDYFI